VDDSVPAGILVDLLLQGIGIVGHTVAGDVVGNLANVHDKRARGIYLILSQAADPKSGATRPHEPPQAAEPAGSADGATAQDGRSPAFEKGTLSASFKAGRGKAVSTPESVRSFEPSRKSRGMTPG
jgi:hypothetical protein